MKRMIFGLTFWLGFTATQAQEAGLDTTALTILDNMSQIFGELKSVGFKSRIARDVAFSDYTNIKQYLTSEVKFAGPDKFVTRIHGENGEDLYKYDGSQVHYFSFTHNYFATADAPDNIVETLDWLYTEFNIEFTAADVLYPSFSSDLAENMDHIQFIGVVSLQGERVFHILAQNDIISIQFWIKDDLYMLPKKVVLTYLDKPLSPQYEVEFTDWEMNVDYPESIFQFSPPPAARQVTWMQKN